MGVRARLVEPSEWRRLRDLRLRALAADPPAFGRTFAEESAEPPEAWRARWFGPRGAAFVLEGWDGLCAALLSEDGASAEVLSMWVAPEARRAGAGRALLDAAVAWARAKGARRVTLWVNVAQESARRLYERGGFVAVGEPHRGTRDPTRSFQKMERLA